MLCIKSKGHQRNCNFNFILEKRILEKEDTGEKRINDEKQQNRRIEKKDKKLGKEITNNENVSI